MTAGPSTPIVHPSSMAPEIGSLGGLLLCFGVGALAFVLPWLVARVSYEPPPPRAETLQSVVARANMAPPPRVVVIPAAAPAEMVPLPDPEEVGNCYDTSLW